MIFTVVHDSELSYCCCIIYKDSGPVKFTRPHQLRVASRGKRPRTRRSKQRGSTQFSSTSRSGNLGCAVEGLLTGIKGNMAVRKQLQDPITFVGLAEAAAGHARLNCFGRPSFAMLSVGRKREKNEMFYAAMITNESLIAARTFSHPINLNLEKPSST